MNSTNNKNIVIALAIVITTAAALWFMWTLIFSVLDNFANIANINERNMNPAERKVFNMRSELQVSDRYAKKLSSVMLSENDVPELLNTIEEISDNYLSVSGVSESLDGGVLRVSVKSKCVLSDCISHLLTLSKINPLTGVQELQILKGEDMWELSTTVTIPLR